jgi:site-specific recombinase XerD
MKGLPIHSKHFEQLLKEFDKEIQTRGYRVKGNMYGCLVREFLFFLENIGILAIQDVKATEIIAYYEYIRERPNQRKEGVLSDSMIRHHLFSLRLFFDYLLESGHIETSPARLPKFQITTRKERNICTVEEIKQLFEACDTKRDKALLTIAYGCGLRRSEIEKLNAGDVLLHKGILVVREGKGGKHRTIPLSNNSLKHLKEYLIYERTANSSDHTDHSPAFFINHNGARIHGDKHNERLKYLISKTKNVGLLSKEITLHCLRHSLATHLIDNGASIEFVQQLLGHSEMDTAHLYAKKRKRRLEVMNQFNPKENGNNHL